MAESTLEPPSGFEHGTPVLLIQRIKQYAVETTEEPTTMSAKCVLNKFNKQAHINITTLKNIYIYMYVIYMYIYTCIYIYTYIFISFKLFKLPRIAFKKLRNLGQFLIRTKMLKALPKI